MQLLGGSANPHRRTKAVLPAPQSDTVRGMG